MNFNALIVAHAAHIVHGNHSAVDVHRCRLHLPNGVVEHQFGWVDVDVRGKAVVAAASEQSTQIDGAFICPVGHYSPTEIGVEAVVHAVAIDCYHGFALLERIYGLGS